MKPSPPGQQRLSIAQLQAWQELHYGMFIHFGMSTFDGEEFSPGDKPATHYAPDHLDVDQWVSVARDAGMKYAILCAKHVSGHALWPTKQSDYHIGASSQPLDVMGAFVEACARRGVRPGVYYCSWDNHHLFGSMTPSATSFTTAYTTHEYREFQLRQVEELLTQYGPLVEVWIDIPGVLGQDGRNTQYAQIARLQPDAVIMFNAGFTHGDKLDTSYTWPTDILAIERGLPCASTRQTSYNPWWQVKLGNGAAQDYYIPGEVCDTIGQSWFYQENDPPRGDEELLGMYLVTRARGCNFLLDVPPDRHGVIPPPYVDALMRLRQNVEKYHGS